MSALTDYAPASIFGDRGRYVLTLSNPISTLLLLDFLIDSNGTRFFVTAINRTTSVTEVLITECRWPRPRSRRKLGVGPYFFNISTSYIDKI